MAVKLTPALSRKLGLAVQPMNFAGRLQVWDALEKATTLGEAEALLHGVHAAASHFDPKLHPRYPTGTPGKGGEFMKKRGPSGLADSIRKGDVVRYRGQQLKVTDVNHHDGHDWARVEPEGRNRGRWVKTDELSPSARPQKHVTPPPSVKPPTFTKPVPPAAPPDVAPYLPKRGVVGKGDRVFWRGGTKEVAGIIPGKGDNPDLVNIGSAKDPLWIPANELKNERKRWKPGDAAMAHGQPVVVKAIDRRVGLAEVLDPSGHGHRKVVLSELREPKKPRSGPKPGVPDLQRGDLVDWNGHDATIIRMGGDVPGVERMAKVRRDSDGFEQYVPVIDLRKKQRIPAGTGPENAAQTSLRNRYEDGGIRKKTNLGGGIQARTNLVTFADGSKGVRKEFPGWSQYSAKDQADAEELSYRVSDAIGGTGAVPTIRLNDYTVMMDHVDGQTAQRWLMDNGIDVHASPLTSLTADPMLQGVFGGPRGTRIGILDSITYNEDRHALNFMMKDDIPVPIDQSSTFGIPGGGWTGPFHQLLQDKVHGQMQVLQPDEIKAIDTRLRAQELAARFNELGKSEWYDVMLKRWDLLKGHMAEAVQASWNPKLHPRGRRGEFIRKGGLKGLVPEKYYPAVEAPPDRLPGRTAEGTGEDRSHPATGGIEVSVKQARDIMTWVNEDPAGRAAQGLEKLTALGSTEPEVRDIGEQLAMMADFVEFEKTNSQGS